MSEQQDEVRAEVRKRYGKRPGGRVAVSDIVEIAPMPAALRKDAEKYVSSATIEARRPGPVAPRGCCS